MLLSWVVNGGMHSAEGRRSVYFVQHGVGGTLKPPAEVQLESLGEQSPRSPLPSVPVEARVLCADSTFAALAAGRVGPEFAYMRGLLRVRGDVSAALRVKGFMAMAAQLSGRR